MAMSMLCSRCKKRVAVVFMTRMENGKTINEGLCLQCAKELGIGPVNELMEKIKRKYMKRTSSVRKEDEDER